MDRSTRPWSSNPFWHVNHNKTVDTTVKSRFLLEGCLKCLYSYRTATLYVPWYHCCSIEIYDIRYALVPVLLEARREWRRRRFLSWFCGWSTLVQYASCLVRICMCISYVCIYGCIHVITQLYVCVYVCKWDGSGTPRIDVAQTVCHFMSGSIILGKRNWYLRDFRSDPHSKDKARATNAGRILVGKKGAKNSLFPLRVVAWYIELWTTVLLVWHQARYLDMVRHTFVYLAALQPQCRSANPPPTSLKGYTLLDQLWRELHEALS